MYSPPKLSLHCVEAKSTCDARRSRGICTLQQDDMHVASDHGKRPTTRIEAVWLLGERKGGEAVSLETAIDGPSGLQQEGMRAL